MVIVIILVDLVILIIDFIIGNFGKGYEIIGMVEFKIIIDVCDVDGIIIVVIIVNEIG